MANAVGRDARARPVTARCGLVGSIVLRATVSPTVALLQLLVVCSPDTLTVESSTAAAAPSAASSHTPQGNKLKYRNTSPPPKEFDVVIGRHWWFITRPAIRVLGVCLRRPKTSPNRGADGDAPSTTP